MLRVAHIFKPKLFSWLFFIIIIFLFLSRPYRGGGWRLRQAAELCLHQGHADVREPHASSTILRGLGRRVSARGGQGRGQHPGRIPVSTNEENKFETKKKKQQKKEDQTRDLDLRFRGRHDHFTEIKKKAIHFLFGHVRAGFKGRGQQRGLDGSYGAQERARSHHGQLCLSRRLGRFYQRTV